MIFEFPKLYPNVWLGTGGQVLLTYLMLKWTTQIGVKPWKNWIVSLNVDVETEMHEIATQLVPRWARRGFQHRRPVTDELTGSNLDTNTLSAMDCRSNVVALIWKLQRDSDPMVKLQTIGAKIMFDERFDRLPKSPWKLFGSGVQAYFGRSFA